MGRSDSVGKRLLDAVARAARRREEDGARLDVLDAGELWVTWEEVAEAARSAAGLGEQAAATTARQRGALDGAVERVRGAAGRAAEAVRGTARVEETFDRLAVVALNAGLEGARLGDAAGRALGLVADEVRGHAGRGAEAAGDVAELVGQLAGEIDQLLGQLDPVRALLQAAAEQSARAQAEAQRVAVAVEGLGERMRHVAGSDPEVARIAAEARGHAQALIDLLSSMSLGASTRLSGSVVVSALTVLLRKLGPSVGRVPPGAPARGGDR